MNRPPADQAWTVDRHEMVALGAVLVLALVLRLVHLGYESLWSDEAFTAWWAKQTVAELWGPNARYDTTPPLYYTLARLSVLTLGDSEAALRFPAALLGTLGVAAVFALGRSVGGTRVGLLAALLTAVAAPHIRYSQEARAYALLSLLGVLAVLGCVLFFRAAVPPLSRRLAIFGLAIYVFATAGALYTHNTAVLLPLLANIAATVWWLVCSRRLLPLALWLGANLLVLASWLWWLPILMQSAGAENLDYMVQPTPGWAGREWVRFFGWRYLRDYYLLQVVPGLTILCIAALGCYLRPGPGTLTLGLFLFGVPTGLFALGLLGHPVWLERTFFWPFPFAMVLVAVALLEFRPAWVRHGAIAAVVALSLANLAFYYLGHQKEPFREVVAHIAEGLQPRDAVLFVPGTDILTATTYYQLQRGLVLDTYAVDPVRDKRTLGIPYDFLPFQPPVARRPTVLQLGELRQIPDHHDRVWVIYRRKDKSDPRDLVQETFGSYGRVAGSWSYDPFLQVALIEFTESAKSGSKPISPASPL